MSSLVQFTPDQWAAIAAIAQVLAALATLVAVLFAIYQWNHQWRPKLQVSLNTVMFPQEFGKPREYIGLEVNNTGICAVKITGIQYRPHRFSKTRWFHPPDFANPLCSKLPKKLEQTDGALFLWSHSDWDKAISDALEAALNRSKLYRLFWRRLLLVKVNTSIGESFAGRVPHRLISRLDAQITNPDTVRVSE